MISLYLKTHNKTGLKYLGKTINDPFCYKGSGKYWTRHITKHGYDVTTEILLETNCKTELKEKGEYYSMLWDIVASDDFANLRNETGDGGDTSKTPGYQAGMAEWQASDDFIKNKERSSAQQKERIKLGLNPICGKAGKDNPMFGKTGSLHHGYNIPRSESTKQKISMNHQDVSGSKNANAKTFEFIDPDGNKYTVTGGFKTFCKEHNLSFGTMFNVVYKKQKNPRRGNCKNWRVEKL